MRTVLAPLCAATIAAVPLSAQNAAYHLQGHGCNGSGISTCAGNNDQTPSFRLASLPNEYAYPVVNTNPVPIFVFGFELFTQSNGGATVSANTAIYLDASGPGATTLTQPAFTASATGTILAHGTAGWCATTVSPPIAIGPGEVFWLGADAFGLIAPPQNNGGSAGPAAPWWRRPNYLNNGWVVSGSVSNPIWRLHCASAGATVPALTASGGPQLGQQFTLRIAGGSAMLPAFLVWANDTTTWQGLPLPLNLAPFGAPDCINYTTTDTANLLVLDAQGAGSTTVTIPNNTRLAGTRFYNQAAAVVLGANAIDLLTTSYGSGRVGF